MKPEETAAAELLESILRARVEPLDIPGAPDSTCDYAIVRPGQSDAALEVTMLADEQRLSLTAAMEEHGLVLDTDELASAWWVELREDAQRGRYRNVPDQLVKVPGVLRPPGLRHSMPVAAIRRGTSPTSGSSPSITLLC